MALILIIAGLLGHVILGAWVFNQVHARALPRWLCKLLTLAQALAMALVPLALAHRLGTGGTDVTDWRAWPAALGWPATLYGALCLGLGTAGAAWWAWWRCRHRPPGALRSCRARLFDLRATGQGNPSGAATSACPSDSASDPAPKTTFAGRPEPPGRPVLAGLRRRIANLIIRLPGNQAHALEVVERGIEFRRLAPALDGLSVVHLSDLHFSGRVGKAFFHEVVRLCNQLDPDLVAATGDLADRPECAEWIPEILGKLTSRFGAYFILGNHDQFYDAPRLRQAAMDAGLRDLGGRWIECEIRGQRVVLGGNELPWFAMPTDRNDPPPPADDSGPLRIALSHCPDQLPWARAHQVDLLLAGHTHGGQVCLPWAGAIVSASRLGVRYASGIFHVPPTLMHVTRGVSSELPLRLNCPPQITKLTLHAASH